ncbi:MAG TPA: carboxymuconolactone decarboxylase family protein [Dehalococcoidia bacterium]|nr:carboxymuconolactone decarboxylase family protein [Dehalococcoidia bacterium]
MTTAEELYRHAANLHAFIDQYVPAGRLTGALPGISRDYVKLQDEVMWGGIWQVPGLDINLRSMATIAAQCCNGWDFGLHHQIRVGLTLGMSPQKIKGMFLQLMFYAGIPATVFALTQAQKVINEQEMWKAEDRLPLKAEWLASVEEKLKRGARLRRNNWGEQADHELENSLTQQLLPEVADLVEAYNYGEVWARADLSPKERMVCILVALMCRGHMKQLRQHVGYSLNMGFTQREICEVFSQAGWYRGWPCVEEALQEAATVFAARTT